MAITEENRHALDTRLEEVLGREEAAVLMEHLPPVGWSDVATKRDLELLKTQLELAMERNMREIENRFTVRVGAILTLLVAVQAVIQQLAG